jgi:hypothetical protein
MTTTKDSMKLIQYTNKVSVFIPSKTDRKSRLSFNGSLHSTSHSAQFKALRMQHKKGPVGVLKCISELPSRFHQFGLLVVLASA